MVLIGLTASLITVELDASVHPGGGGQEEASKLKRRNYERERQLHSTFLKLNNKDM